MAIRLPTSPWLVAGIAASSLLLQVSCASTPTGTLALTLGGETDTLTRAPAPVSLAIDSIDSSGTPTSIAHVSLPATTVNLPDQSEEATGILRVTGVDAAGITRVWGETLPVQYGGIGGSTLEIFIQRVNEMARMPGAFSDGREAPLLANLSGGQYILVAGGSDMGLAATTQVYDLIGWAPLPSPPSMPRAATSMVTQGTIALLINAAGASEYDFDSSTSSDLATPTGGSFSEVAGGATIYAADGSAYVVGATRATGPTVRILKVDTTGALSFVALTTARVGAYAAWVEGRGLYVGGGSATAPGGEILAPTATATASLAYPPDATTGAGAVALDGTSVLVAGGVNAKGLDSGSRVIDVSCAAACMAKPWLAPFSPPLPLAQAFALPNGDGLVVGEDAAGMSHVLRITAMGETPIPLKLPRNHARALALPNGAFAVIGGASVAESFAP